MPPILVTGGAGFIGSCFVRQWLAHEPEPVVVVDKLTYAGTRESLAETAGDARLTFIQADIADATQVRQVLAEHRPQAVVHLAAETHVDRSVDGPAPFVWTNVVGTFELLEATRAFWESLPAGQRRSFRFVHVSTDEVFGSLPQQGRFTPDSPYAPNSPYAASKAAGDHFVRASGRTFGLPVIITHSSNNYGPYQFPEKLVPLMILNAFDGRPLPIYGDGSQVRDWLYVEDHCRGLRAALHRGQPGDVYLFGGNCELSNLDVVRSICAAVDQLWADGRNRTSLITHVADRPGHDRRYALDSSASQRTLGWTPTVPWSVGLPRTVQWYRDHPDWVRLVTERYDRSRLGERGKLTVDS